MVETKLLGHSDGVTRLTPGGGVIGLLPMREHKDGLDDFSRAQSKLDSLSHKLVRNEETRAVGLWSDDLGRDGQYCRKEQRTLLPAERGRVEHRVEDSNSHVQVMEVAVMSTRSVASTHNSNIS